MDVVLAVGGKVIVDDNALNKIISFCIKKIVIFGN